ncbi:hypothetical protein C8R44DRAFT_778298 [Mycena epipterygia]|nr:hypothetical protein C8R44DRAFT_778298 [Mycena epipterygia]
MILVSRISGPRSTTILVPISLKHKYLASPPALDGTLGCIQIGLVFATFLFGIETLQTFNYYRDYPKDVAMLKILVAGIWFLELAYTICGWHAMYLMTVTFYGQPQHIMAPPRSLIFTILLHGIIHMAVETFFAVRVGMLSTRWPITILFCLLNLLCLVFYIVQFTRSWMAPNLSRLARVEWVFITVSSIGAVVDLGIATSVVYHLWHVRRSHWKETTKMVDTIIIWTIETTVITSIASILKLIFFLAGPDLAWMVFYLIQAKLFSNAMLASLNGRRRLRPSDSNGITFASPGQPSVVVQMQRTVERTVDDDAAATRSAENLEDCMDSSIKAVPVV